jgi:hypothetical protein
MNTITLTQGDIAAINPALLAEEVAAALGVEVSVQAVHERGRLVAASLARVDGVPFTQGQMEIVRAVIAHHDEALLSSAEWAEADRQRQRQSAARVLVQYDPAGIAASIDTADTFEALRSASGQLADLAMLLAVLAGK